MMRLIATGMAAGLLTVGAAAHADVEVRTSNSTENVEVKTGDAVVNNTESATATQESDTVATASVVTVPGQPAPDAQVAAVSEGPPEPAEAGEPSAGGNAPSGDGEGFSQTVVAQTAISV